jgi:hypothetical protein
MEVLKWLIHQLKKERKEEIAYTVAKNIFGATLGQDKSVAVKNADIII